MAYEGKCGSCANFEDDHGNPFNPRWAYPAKGYCTWYKRYYFPDESCDDKHYRPRSYITTMVCGRLGLDKDDEVYKSIVGFQKNVMEKDKNYERLLEKYDAIGPKISKELETEDISIVKKIYNIFLVPVAALIKENKGDEAIYRYKSMLAILKVHYGIENENSKVNHNQKSFNKMKVLAVKKNI